MLLLLLYPSGDFTLKAPLPVGLFLLERFGAPTGLNIAALRAAPRGYHMDDPPQPLHSFSVPILSRQSRKTGSGG
jgi:hypothetical protein